MEVTFRKYDAIAIKKKNKMKKIRDKTIASIKSGTTLFPAIRLLIAEVYISFRDNLPPSLIHKYTFKMWSAPPLTIKENLIVSFPKSGIFGKFNPFIFIVITMLFDFILNNISEVNTSCI